jgi:hypothetical protein
MCICRLYEPAVGIYGDDCPYCGAEATTRAHLCDGTVAGPFCPEHAERIRLAVHQEWHVLRST